jgi:hypothetical protein
LIRSVLDHLQSVLNTRKGSGMGSTVTLAPIRFAKATSCRTVRPATSAGSSVSGCC